MLLDAIIGVPDTLGTSFLPAGKLPPIQKHRDCHHIPMWVSNYGILAVSSHDLFPASKANPLSKNRRYGYTDSFFSRVDTSTGLQISKTAAVRLPSGVE